MRYLVIYVRNPRAPCASVDRETVRILCSSMEEEEEVDIVGGEDGAYMSRNEREM